MPFIKKVREFVNHFYHSQPVPEQRSGQMATGVAVAPAPTPAVYAKWVYSYEEFHKAFDNRNGKNSFAKNAKVEFIPVGSGTTSIWLRNPQEKVTCVALACSELEMRYAYQKAEFTKSGGFKAYRAAMLDSSEWFLKYCDDRVKTVSRGVEMQVLPQYHHFVSPSQWGHFFLTQSVMMANPIPKQKIYKNFYIATHQHAMVATLVKHGEEGGHTSYSVSIFDPNATYNHQKVRCQNAQELIKVTRESFFTPVRLEGYDIFSSKTVTLSHADPRNWDFIEIPDEVMESPPNSLELPDEYICNYWDPSGAIATRVISKQGFVGGLTENPRESYKKIDKKE